MQDILLIACMHDPHDYQHDISAAKTSEQAGKIVMSIKMQSPNLIPHLNPKP